MKRVLQIFIIGIILIIVSGLLLTDKFKKTYVIDYDIKSISFVDYNPLGGVSETIDLSKEEIDKLIPYLNKVYLVKKYNSEKIKVQCKPVFTYSDYLIIDDGKNKYRFYYNGGCGDNLTKEGKYNGKKVEFSAEVYDKIVDITKNYEQSGELDE